MTLLLALWLIPRWEDFTLGTRERARCVHACVVPTSDGRPSSPIELNGTVPIYSHSIHKWLLVCMGPEEATFYT